VLLHFHIGLLNPIKTITSYFETITPKEATESVKGLPIETTTDITKESSSNAYIPNVLLEENMNTSFSFTVDITFDRICLDDSIIIEFKPNELSDIEDIEKKYDIQKDSFHGMSKINS